MPRLVALCLGVLLLLAASARADYTTYLVDQQTYPLAACLDGSAPGYAVEMSTNPQSTKWQLYIQGGGWCYEPTDCLTRSTTTLGSSKQWPATWGTMGGLVASDPLVSSFADYNRVMLIYCDGNSFTGQRLEPYSINGTQLYSRGRFNLDAILDDLSNNPVTASLWAAADTVMVTGCSAGGLSSIMNGDYIISRLPQSPAPKSGIVAISGFFLDSPNALGTPVYADEIQGASAFANNTGSMLPGCLAEHAGESWRCNMAQYVFPYVTSPIFILNSLADLWQLWCIYTAVPVAYNSPSNGYCGALWSEAAPSCLNASTDALGFCNATQINSLNKYSALFSSIISAATPANTYTGGFLNSCVTHCDGQDSSCYSFLHINGVSMSAAVDQWWQDMPSNGAPIKSSTDYWHFDCSEFTVSDPQNCNSGCAMYC